MDIVHQNHIFGLFLKQKRIPIGFLNFGAYLFLMDIKFEIKTFFSPDLDHNF